MMEDKIYFEICENLPISDSVCENYVKPVVETIIKPILQFLFPKKVPLVDAI
jgi:hypothetical protein